MITVRYHETYLDGKLHGLTIPVSVEFNTVFYAKACEALMQGYEHSGVVLQKPDGKYRVHDVRVEPPFRKRVVVGA